MGDVEVWGMRIGGKYGCDKRTSKLKGAFVIEKGVITVHLSEVSNQLSISRCHGFALICNWTGYLCT